MMWRLARDHQFALQLSKSSQDTIHHRHYKDIVNIVKDGMESKQRQFQNQLNMLSTIGRDCSSPGGTVDLVRGFAKFTSPHEISVVTEDGTCAQKISSEYFVIATGSSPRSPKEPVVDGHHIMTSEHLLELKHFPKSMMIVGAGYFYFQ